VALCIERARLPLSGALRERFDLDEALRCALSGGDDYRLAFTLPANELAALQAEFPEVAMIGQVEAGEGVHLYDEQGRELALAARGYQHFG
jgi:thiamine-monophosphate kinase